MCDQKCDNCRDVSEIEQVDVTNTALAIIDAAREITTHEITRVMLIDIMQGKTGTKQNKDFRQFKSHGRMKDTPKDRLERVFDHLCLIGVLDFVTVQRRLGWRVVREAL